MTTNTDSSIISEKQTSYFVKYFLTKQYSYLTMILTSMCAVVITAYVFTGAEYKGVLLMAGIGLFVLGAVSVALKE